VLTSKSTQLGCQCVLRSLHHHPASSIVVFWPDGENPYLVHPYSPHEDPHALGPQTSPKTRSRTIQLFCRLQLCFTDRQTGTSCCRNISCNGWGYFIRHKIVPSIASLALCHSRFGTVPCLDLVQGWHKQQYKHRIIGTVSFAFRHCAVSRLGTRLA